VVDAMRRQIGAAGAQGAALAREDQLRADAVGRGREEAAVTERMQRRKLPEAMGSGRLDRCAQPVDDGVGRGERDAGRVVRPSFLRHAPSLWPRLDEQLAEELGTTLRAAAYEADDGFAHLHAGSVAVDVEDLSECLRLARRVVRLEMQLG